MSKKETPVKAPAVKYAGIAIQRTNIRMKKLSSVMTNLKAIMAKTPDATIIEVTHEMYAETFDTMTQEEFENKQWYVSEKLMPLLNKSSSDVYQEALDEEQAKTLDIDEAKEEFTW